MGIIRDILNLEAINTIAHTCVFCGGIKDTKFVNGYGIYGSVGLLGNYYHEKCVRKICADPESYTSREVDMALDIIDRIEMLKQEEEEKNKKRIENNKRIKEHCI